MSDVRVTGRVVSTSRVGLGGLHVELVDHDLGSVTALGTVTTDDEGRFATTVPTRTSKARPDLQARLRTAPDADLLAQSDLTFDVEDDVELVIVLPDDAAGLTSEYAVLTAALDAVDPERAAKLTADASVAIAYLARKTRWDARAITLAVAAERLANADADAVLPPALVYALLRAGLPSDPAALFRTDPDLVVRTWETAIARGVVDGGLTAAIPDARRAFVTRAVGLYLTTPGSHGGATPDRLLDRTFGDDQDARRRFAELRVTAGSDLDAFWDDVAEELGLDRRDELRLIGKLAALTLDDAGVVDALLDAEAATGDPVRDPADLARRGYGRAERWAPLITGPVPRAVEGEDDPAAAYAELLAAQVRLRFPARVLAERVRSGHLLGAGADRSRAAVAAFLDDHDDRLDFATTPVVRHVDRLARDGEEVAPEVVAEVTRIQRVFHLTPSDDALEVLIERGLDSAHAIARRRPDDLVSSLADVLPEADVRLVHGRAVQRHQALLSVAMAYGTSRRAPVLGAAEGAPLLDARPAPPATFAADSGVLAYPTLEGLFGSMDVRSCDHCRSVLSPAAYLVDLLQWLDRPDLGDHNPLEVLRRRRPDIQHLALTCENTNTTLPYIDIVNEALEHMVAANDTSLGSYEGHDTDPAATVDGLLARPRFVDERVYATLAQVDLPPPLPFDRSRERLRRLFARFELTLGDALAALRPGQDDESWDRIWFEHLGLSDREVQILSAPDTSIAAILGYPTGTTPAQVQQALTSVGALARRLDVSYEELLALRLVPSVSPSGPLRVKDPGPGGTPTPFAQLQLVRPDGGALGVEDLLRLARFVRLWRRLGWSIADLDAGLKAAETSPSTVPTNRTTLLCLGVIHAAGERLGVTAAERAAYLRQWGTDSSDLTWLARRLRVSKAELDLMQEWALDHFVIGFATFSPPPIIALIDLCEALTAAGLSLAEVLLIVWNRDVIGAGTVIGGDVDALARSLRAAQDAVARDLAGDASDPARAQAQIASVVGPEAADGIVAVLDGALAVSVEVPTPVVISAALATATRGRLSYDGATRRLSLAGTVDDAVAAALAASVPAASIDALRTAGAERVRTDPAFAAGIARLVVLLDGQPALETALVAWATAPGGPEDGRAAALASLLATTTERRRRDAALTTVAAALGAETALVEAVVTDRAVLHADGDPDRAALDDVVAVALADGPDTTVDARDQGALEPPQARTLRLGLSVSSGGGAPTLAVDGSPIALVPEGDLLVSPGPVLLAPATLRRVAVEAPGRATLWWQRDGRPWEPVPARHLYAADGLDRLRNTIGRLGRANALAAATGLTPGELVHLAVSPTLEIGGAGWLNALPGVGRPTDPEVELIARLRTLLELVRLKAVFQDDAGGVVAVLNDPAEPEDGPDSLLALTRWDADDLEEVLERLGLERADLTDVAAFGRVERAMAVPRAFGVPAASVLAATTANPTPAAVTALEAALRSRFGASAWLVVQRAISDDLRDVQRDALVSVVLRRFADTADRRHIDTPDKLYEHMLMDVQMEACAQTSRIRHAIATVQLFVERVLMNLERGLSPTVVSASQWAWMKRYRVWEANRKVFLWPENWLDPALRREQSIPFRTTMGQLLQGDINEDTAAAGLLGYLSSLGEVAQLEPCGVHHLEGRDLDGDEVTHVVARTPGTPRRYHHRRRDLGTWTPWEPIDVDIEDNPVVPVVWKGRLFLFWARLLQANGGSGTTATASDQTDLASMPYGSAKQEGARVVKLIPQVVLCWSERYDGRWLPARTSDVARPASFARSYEMAAGASAFDRSKLVMGETYEGDTLRVRVWSAEIGASYLMLNTHSLPVRQEDRPAPKQDANLASARQLSATGPSFSVTYMSNPTIIPPIPPVTRTLFTPGDTAYRTVAPYPMTYLPGGVQASALRDVWTAPFFYADGRHVFHVQTRRERATFAEHDDFGVAAPRPEPREIPSLLRLGADDVIDDLVIPPSPDDPRALPFERVVPAGTDLHTVIASSAEVHLGGRSFGPLGGLDV